MNPDIDPRWYPPCCEWEDYIGTTDNGHVIYPEICNCICHTEEEEFFDL